VIALTPVVAAGEDPDRTLNVALYPYVPSPEGIQEVIRGHWEARHPDVELRFLEWDGGYGEDPPPEADVFEADALMLDHLVANNFAARIDLEEMDRVDDFYDFALRGSMVRGEPYGIPRLACHPVLMYRHGDAEVEVAEGIDELFRVIGEDADEAVWPPRGEGLLIDLTGGTTCACYYLDALADTLDTFSNDQPLPSASELEEGVLDRLRLLTRMAGEEQAGCEECYGQRAEQFAAGHGRALIGWTERLAKMPLATHEGIRIRPLPLADDDGVNLVFVDTLMINSTLVGERRGLAIEFAKLASSPAVMVETLLVKDEETGSPQYLLPVRRSVMEDRRLRGEAPLYRQLEASLEDRPRAFRLGPGARYWLERTKGAIRSAITDLD
jgi:thiamine pyridinylase